MLIIIQRVESIWEWRESANTVSTFYWGNGRSWVICLRPPGKWWWKSNNWRCFFYHQQSLYYLLTPTSPPKNTEAVRHLTNTHEVFIPGRGQRLFHVPFGRYLLFSIQRLGNFKAIPWLKHHTGAEWAVEIWILLQMFLHCANTV